MIHDRIAPAHLERWMRAHYFDTDFDLGSSGVEPFTFAELRELVGITVDELDAVSLQDSRTLGGDELRQAIADRWGGGDPAEVMATHGSSEGIFLVMHALLQPDDELVVLEPAYQQLRAIAETIGCRIVEWRMRPENGFRPDVRELQRLLSRRTRLVVINLPHNPTGIALTADEEDEIAEYAATHGAHVLWDRAFADLVHAPRASVRRRRAPHEIVLGTLSKAYGLPGLRVGWLVAAPPLFERCAHLRDYTTLHLSPLVELIARRAIASGDRLLAARLPEARRNLDALTAWIAAHDADLEWTPPDAGVCVFPRLKRVRDVDGFCRELARAARVLLVPGSCFAHPDHVRLGYGASAARFDEGLRRISAVLATAAVFV